MREHTFYILRSLLTTAAGVTAALACAIWLSQSLRFLDFIVNRGLSVIDFLQLTLLLLPTVLMATVPVAALCAVIHTYNRLASDRELVALRTAGVSDWGLARPALILGVLFTAVGFALSLYLTPAGFRAFKDEQFLLRSDFSRVLLREGVFNRVGDDLTVYVRARDRNGRLLGILVHDDRNPEAAVTMMAEWGALDANPREPMFVLGKGARQERSADGALTMLYFDSYALDLSPLVETPAARYREPKERYLHELLREPQTVNDRTYRDELVAEAHRRLVTPFDALALSLIAAAAIGRGPVRPARAVAADRLGLRGRVDLHMRSVRARRPDRQESRADGRLLRPSRAGLRPVGRGDDAARLRAGRARRAAPRRAESEHVPFAHPVALHRPALPVDHRGRLRLRSSGSPS